MRSSPLPCRGTARPRNQQRVFVFQGLGGLGKSTLSFEVLKMLSRQGAELPVCTLWCQEVKQAENPAEALVQQLLKFCRERFGADWEQVVQQVDIAAGDGRLGDAGQLQAGERTAILDPQIRWANEPTRRAGKLVIRQLAVSLED